MVLIDNSNDNNNQSRSFYEDFDRSLNNVSKKDGEVEPLNNCIAAFYPEIKVFWATSQAQSFHKMFLCLHGFAANLVSHLNFSNPLTTLDWAGSVVSGSTVYANLFTTSSPGNEDESFLIVKFETRISQSFSHQWSIVEKLLEGGCQVAHVLCHQENMTASGIMGDSESFTSVLKSVESTPLADAIDLLGYPALHPGLSLSSLEACILSHCKVRNIPCFVYPCRLEYLGGKLRFGRKLLVALEPLLNLIFSSKSINEKTINYESSWNHLLEEQDHKFESQSSSSLYL